MDFYIPLVATEKNMDNFNRGFSCLEEDAVNTMMLWKKFKAFSGKSNSYTDVEKKSYRQSDDFAKRCLKREA